MKIKLIALGKISNAMPEHELCLEYKKRLLYKIDIQEINSKNIKEEDILRHIQKNDFIICLDENGYEYNSTEFARKLESLQNIYTQLVFIIGGSEGHLPQVKSKANLLLSLSKMTFPHKLARIMFLEQLYRAQTILFNHPYHK